MQTQDKTVTSSSSSGEEKSRSAFAAIRAKAAAPLITFEFRKYIFQFRDYPNIKQSIPTVKRIYELTLMLYRGGVLDDPFNYDPNFIKKILDCGSGEDIFVLLTIIHRRYVKAAATIKNPRKHIGAGSEDKKLMLPTVFKRAISEADRHKRILEIIKSTFIRKNSHDEWDMLYYFHIVAWQRAYDEVSFEYRTKLYLILTPSNFNNAVKTLGLLPRAVGKDTYLSLCVTGYLYRLEPFNLYDRKEKEIETEDEIIRFDRKHFKEILLRWHIIEKVLTKNVKVLSNGELDSYTSTTVRKDWYKLPTEIGGAKLEYHWPDSPKVISETKSYIDSLYGKNSVFVDPRVNAVHKDKTVKKQVGLDKSKHTMDVNLSLGIQACSIFAHIINFVRNIKEAKDLKDFTMAVVESFTLLAVNANIAGYIAHFIQNSKLIDLFQNFCKQCLDAFRKKTTQKTSELVSTVLQRTENMDTVKDTIQSMGHDISVYTSYFDVFQAMKNSDFYDHTVALIGTLKFSLIINSVMHWCNPSGTFRIILNTFEDMLRNMGSFTTLESIWSQLFSDIVPALLTGNPDYIKPSLFYRRVDLIEKAIGLANNNDDSAILEVCREWLDEPIEPVNLYAVFNDILADMRNFLQKMNPNSRSVNIAKLQSNLTLAQICITGQATYGQNRREPFCVGLWGAPGVGKTTAIQKITMWLSQPCKLSMRKNVDGSLSIPHIVPVTDTTKFCDNVNNGTQVICFDDLGITHDKNVPAGANAYSLFMQVQGNVPVPIPRSDIESKKNQFFSNKLTFVTSNHKDYGALTMIKELEAFKRRIHANIEFVLENHDNYDSRYYIVDYYDNSNRKHDIVEYRSKTTDLKIRALENDNMLKNGLIKHCVNYIESRDNYISNSRGLTLCSLCKKIRFKDHIMSDACLCSVPVIGSLDPVSGLWLSQETVKEIPVSSCIFQAIAEEAVMRPLQELYTFWSVEHLTSGLKFSEKWLDRFASATQVATAFQFAILRECVEYYVKGEISPLRVILFTGLGCLPATTGLGIHILFNIPYIFKAKYNYIITPVNAAYKVVDNKLKSIVSWICWSLTPVWYAKYILKETYSSCKNVIMDETVQKVGKVIGVSLVGISLLVGVSKIYQYTQRPQKAEFTALGDKPSERDIEANQKLSDMVGGVYDINDIDVSGKTNDYRPGFKPLFRKSNGSIPKSVESGLVTIVTSLYDDKGEFVFRNGKTQGVYSNGYIETCGHTIGPHDYIDKKNCNAKSVFYFNNTPQTTYQYSFVKGGPWVRGKHDTLRFPFSLDNRKTIKTTFDFKAQKNDVFLVGNIEGEFEIYCETNGSVTTFNGETYIEPPGGYAINYQSVAGDSGLPVYLYKRDGSFVEPVVVGILSRKSTTLADRAVFVPIETIEKYTNDMLVSTVDVDEICNYFSSVGYPIEKETIKDSSILRHIDDISQFGILVGQANIPTHKTKSSFYKTKFYEKAVKMVPSVSELCVPNLKSRVVNGVYHDHMLSSARRMCATGQIRNEAPFFAAADIVAEILEEQLDLNNWKPISLEMVLKGTGRTNPLNLKAAVGFPHGGMIKSEIVVGDTEHPMFNEVFSKEIQEAYERLDRGEHCLNIAKCAIKDEILSVTKDREARARIFFAGNLPFLVVCRQLLSTLMDMFTAKRSTLFGKIGMNAIGVEFDDMLRSLHLEIHGNLDDFMLKPNWWDGDFKSYDTTLLLFRYAVFILWRMAQKAPYFKQHPIDLNRIKLVLESLLVYVVIMEGTVFMMVDKMPSGMWATSMLNCICEMIIEVLMFYYLIYIQTKSESFGVDFVTLLRDQHPIKGHIAVANYGDDNIKHIHDDYVKFYNHEAATKFARWIRMGITPARKHEQILQCKTVTDIMFLKRVPKYNPFLERLVGCLDIQSIGKMLAFTDSHSPDWEKSVLLSARRELAFHGKEIYDKFFQIFNLEYIPIEETLSTIDDVVWGLVEPLDCCDE